jgi:hypothetical protein
LHPLFEEAHEVKQTAEARAKTNNKYFAFIMCKFGSRYIFCKETKTSVLPQGVIFTAQIYFVNIQALEYF